MLRYIILLLLFNLELHAQERNDHPFIQLVWYNVENAFDTIDSPITHDAEYLPQSDKKWTSRRYWTKLNRISKVLRNATGWNPPDIIALGEVENADVLYHISTRPALLGANYRVIHYESPDYRGIDVGILYNPNVIQMFVSRAIPIDFPNHPQKRTRDLLLASGTLASGDTLHIIAAHWPSRRGGKEHSEPFRIRAAQICADVVDSLARHSQNLNLIITGDFNDGPHDASIDTLIQARRVKLNNAMREMPSTLGTHRYGAEWEYLDQWMYSENLQNGPIQVDTTYIYYNPSMIEPVTSLPGFRPKRSWNGNFFTNGYSDHLPIVLILNDRTQGENNSVH
ncbi:endonuclease/exonuclease/phosphatase family protein [Phaeocystidibacter marisrubri]|uniref:Endonuclease/exonuclease/phosphatase domain-containing protein n=1 Tax=Phaeocystidibacter marisrubri TaxID=1577780 RepID=A0A6L3ZI57_9FLAO|nr:endonuclease/exonuclease/phosphatase family protein [Phaeocystidibacter marisrubri]KAB2817165.1 hypothetical protein F8C82_01845 [Phaeocystidibacter marisrubri]GGH76594.1 endonuclease [Phaeocystidibacter marisrubri]